MKQNNYSVIEESFINQAMRKYQAYAINDIENKMYQNSSRKHNEEFDDKLFLELLDQRTYYEKATDEELIIDFINSAKDRFREEQMSYAKTAFDLILSKKKFSSYH